VGQLPEIAAKHGTGRGTAAGQEPATPTNDDLIVAVRAHGRRVKARRSGLQIDTQGQQSDPTLMTRLHAATDQQATWPDAVLADPGEVILRGELNLIEQETHR
jgi:hypothetical protein